MRRTILAFCLFSVVFITAATMVSEPESDDEDDEKKSNINNNNNDNKKQNENTQGHLTSDCKLENKLDCINNNNEINENIEDEEQEDEEEQEEEEEEEEQDEESGGGEEIQGDDDEIKMFGVSLVDLMKFQYEMNQGEDDEDGNNVEEDKDKIPFILEVLMNKIKELDGFQTEGIFRTTGNMKDVEDLANNGFDPYSEDLNQYEVATWASLLKKWIRDLPDPLIPDPVYNQLILLSSKLSNNVPSTQSPIPTNVISSILKTIEPQVSYDVLESLGLFFAELLQPDNVNITKIDIDSITTIMTPTIFKPKIEISQENLKKIMATQANEKQIFKSILYYFIDEFNQKQQEQQDEDQEQDEQDEDQEEEQEE